MATGKRHSPEQVVRKLMAADRLLAEGKDTAAVCRELGVSEATYHRWRNQFGGLRPKTRSGSRSLSARTPPSNGYWLMPSWRRLRSRRLRGETSRPGTPAGGSSSSPAGAGG
jgi:hypothetical protein